MLYPVAIQQRDKIFYAHLPDIPELEIEDTSIADTISTARQVVMEYLSELAEEEQSLPESSIINTHLTNPKYAGWTWAMVSIDAKRIIGEKVEISIPIQQRLYQRLQQHISENDISLDDFVITAIKNTLK